MYNVHMSGQRTHDVDVLVAGGGLVGLTTALLLRHHGVSVELVERRSATSSQPKARRFHTRSMEVFRELGLAGMVHEAARDLAGHDHMAVGRTLAEAQQLPLWLPSAADDEEGDGVEDVEVSPEPPCLIAQDLLEPVLRDAAVDAGARVRFGTELVGFVQDADGVSADLGGGQAMRCAFLVAADGARSGTRAALGIGRSGRGAVGEPSVSVYFLADLADVVRGREFNLCHIQHAAAPGTLASVDGRLRWVFMAADRPAADWPRILRTALGVPAPDLQVLSVLTWQPEMLVADRYADGRVFLAGDAAHVMPPYAASGANTGIADAHNLAWKLAAVLRGDAAPTLLDSYHAERHPAGWFVADHSTRYTARFGDPAAADDPTLAHPFVLAAGGFQYPDGALVHGVGEVDDPEPVTDFAPAGRVGTRVPHRWLDPVRTRSSIDLAGPGWAVLSGGPTAPALDGLRTVAADLDFLPPGEHLLLRPDHVVAWRGTDPAAVPAVLAGLLHPDPVENEVVVIDKPC
jgi:2-polyprenyl-6-methoxyphenol hydroxylase-like FAD-dependent oxidoreductase